MTSIPACAPPGHNWKLVFADEFNGSIVDATKWADHSSSQSDSGHGNPKNGQLEWNHFPNISVSDGILTITAKREAYTSAAGTQYEWTSGLLSSSPSFSFQYGYIEERAMLPTVKGFWAAFWTWQQPGGDTWQEVDVYEYYSNSPKKLHLTSHVGLQGGTVYRVSFDPSADFHVYGADIQPWGTTWYIDGVPVGFVPGGPSAPTNIITNLSVYGKIPPAVTTDSAVKKVDYIRAYSYDPDAKAEADALPPHGTHRCGNADIMQNGILGLIDTGMSHSGVTLKFVSYTGAEIDRSVFNNKLWDDRTHGLALPSTPGFTGHATLVHVDKIAFNVGPGTNDLGNLVAL